MATVRVRVADIIGCTVGALLTPRAGLVFAHDYHPAAITLEARCYGPQAQHLQEATLWSYVVQILSALKACALAST